MKKLIFIALLAVVGSTVAFAQEKKPVTINYYANAVMDEINATDAQRSAVKELVVKYKNLFKEVDNNKALSEEEATAEKKRLIGERAKEYWKILNPEQTKYLKNKVKGN